MRFLKLVALSAALVLAGCTPAPDPSPEPVVPECTPITGGTPYACTQAEFDDLEAQRTLYAEAEAVLKRYRTELERQEVDWELRELTPEFEATTTGAYRGLVEQLIEADRADQAKRVRGAVVSEWVEPRPGVSRDGSVVALQQCSDASGKWFSTNKATEPVPGVAAQRTYYFVREDGVLKIASSEAQEVEGC